MPDTHEVLNQPPLLGDVDLFATDAVLRAGVEREGAGWAAAQLGAVGRCAGGDAMEWGRLANVHTPVLRTHDRFGRRIDEVEFHPAWHHLMGASVGFGLHGSPWADPRAGAHVARAAGFYLMSQAEAGHGCPISMTYSVLPALRAQPDVAAQWEPRIVSTHYDPRMRPSTEKQGVLCGMAMTEKQGGSDVRANTTRAVPEGRGGPGQPYRLTGHKFFCSDPMCDAFLVLARTEKGIACFLMPRWLPDGTRNRILIQRLKDKLGNRSNASSEIEMDDTWAVMVGEDGRGVATIIEMVQHTRLDCVIGSASGMRQAVVQAVHHARHRNAFGRRLVEQPLMLNVLTDLAVESEAATVLMLRLARAYDESTRDPQAKAFTRLATAVAKFWVCKRQPPLVVEALECLGGGGYVEDCIMPRLFRESPVNGIWEGSGNVIALDVLRAMARTPDVLSVFSAEVGRAAGMDARLDAHVAALGDDLSELGDIEHRARDVVERMAVALQASLLLRHGDAAVAEAFCASRLGGRSGRVFGALPRGVDCARIVERAAAA